MPRFSHSLPSSYPIPSGVEVQRAGRDPDRQGALVNVEPRGHCDDVTGRGRSMAPSLSRRNARASRRGRCGARRGSGQQQGDRLANGFTRHLRSTGGSAIARVAMHTLNIARYSPISLTRSPTDLRITCERPTAITITAAPTASGSVRLPPRSAATAAGALQGQGNKVLSFTLVFLFFFFPSPTHNHPPAGRQDK